MSLINKHWEDLIKPSRPHCTISAQNPNVGRVEIGPFKSGMGITIGNALRRTLLSCIHGAAITAIKIPGITNEFAKIEGVKEDIIDIILCLKSLPIKMHSANKKIITLNAKGGSKVTSGMIETSSDVEILDSSRIICHLSEGHNLSMEMHCEFGCGYKPAEYDSAEEYKEVGLIPVDAIFSPIKKVSYAIKDTMVGANAYDKLVLTIETDGSMTPDVAVELASRILQDQLSAINSFEDSASPAEDQEKDLGFNPALLQRIETLELTVRTRNCMNHANLVYVGDMVTSSEQKMLAIQNFGRKSLNELKEILSNMGLRFGMDVPSWPPENIEELAKRYEDSF